MKLSKDIQKGPIFIESTKDVSNLQGNLNYGSRGPVYFYTKRKHWKEINLHLSLEHWITNSTSLYNITSWYIFGLWSNKHKKDSWLPDITNIPSGLKDASNVKLLEMGFTLYVDNYSTVRLLAYWGQYGRTSYNVKDQNIGKK